MDLRELECFLVLSEELHFGRTAERMYLSQGRVSQLLRSLEQRIGARLLERSSRRVRLTPLGERFLAGLRPAYDGLREAVRSARDEARGVEGVLRVGFLSGASNEEVIGAVAAYEAENPGGRVELSELPLCDPFGALRRGEVDVAVTLLPVVEPDLVVGTVFAAQPQVVALSTRHPLAGRELLSAEELAGCAVLDVRGPAPAYWRELLAPTVTPAGRPIPRGAAVQTLQEALAMVAAGRGGLIVCSPTTRYHGRDDVAFVPVSGLPDSRLGLVWQRDGETERVRAFARAAASTAATPARSASANPAAATTTTPAATVTTPAASAA
ncbi:LysR family transcriptional regulator [Bailinhaonella thermotolerans]|uniref:LysR family transcriptional regulator n=1 Tax=Bailinhaonella thermotolerans TaxID=1070861 RepID=A0A3A4ACA4_9ACTN|nr:LysR family transcriptional regulator [Bailinhaonella thermotolerans]RJL24164.1 LysR family transcriptional regulator [Bailinhaonella thermotolerans]